MESLTSTVSINPQIYPAIPLFKWKCRKNPSTLAIPYSRKIPLHSFFSLYVFRPIPSRNFEISAHFGRHSNRQNYLRKKLTQQQQQPQQVSQDLVHEFIKIDKFESNFSSSGEAMDNLDTSSKNNESTLDNYSTDGKNIPDDNSSEPEGVKELEPELRKKKIGESIMWNKLESWVEQYKKDSEFWGIGTGPIFTIFQDAEGKVERVVVNEDEIMRRSQADPQLGDETELIAEVNFKISFAKDLAREMENGSNVIPKSSSVAKFFLSGGESRVNLMEAIRGVPLKPVPFTRMSRVGVLVLCGLSVVWVTRGLLKLGKDSEQLTTLEKEMLRRKIKARVDAEKMVKGSVELMQDPIEPKSLPFRRPQLDKEELVSSIIKAKGSNSLVEYTTIKNKEFKDKIEEIRAMARHVREIEKRDSLKGNDVEEDYQGSRVSSSQSTSPENGFPTQEEVYDRDSDAARECISLTGPNNDIGQSTEEASNEKCKMQVLNVLNGTESLRSEVSEEKLVLGSSDLNGANLHSDDPGNPSDQIENTSRKKFKIIKSAMEAREYLSRKHHTLEMKQKQNVRDHEFTANAASGNTSRMLNLAVEVCDASPSTRVDGFSYPSEDYSEGSESVEGNMDGLNDLKKSIISSGHEVRESNKDAGISVYKTPGKKETYIGTSLACNSENEIPSFLGDMPDSKSTEFDCGVSIQTEELSLVLKNLKSVNTEKDETLMGLREPSVANEAKNLSAELEQLVSNENWIEKNFHEFEPIVKKIGVGFRGSYQLAREKASNELNTEMDLLQCKSNDAEHEFEWMKDERLKEIVFKVRDNELSGRDPFHLMDEEDKHAFFSGLEKKVEQENEKLLKLHEYFHSNIENLDYGADGISLYDPPEKIMPRWKVPPAEKNPEFLDNFVEQRKVHFTESLKNAVTSKKSAKEIVHKPQEPSSQENCPPVAADVSDRSTEPQKDSLASSKTIIEGSDGSVRAGKKSGKEYWQHTKKWSQGFLESYNAETDPEVKAAMSEIGKDLDRWITEKEIQEAADLMDNIPEKGQKLIKKKLDKVRREMELFGPQAVVSKYREYAEEKEEDYLWWLDLPFVLCIELYTTENGEQRTGFYSLEMAADLELDPKQYHVIAFEDAGDCKNLCYIIQAKMEILGNGNAFVVARQPKDAFREAKANGFSVTVIRKGQLQLNVDQTLEEVEESIVEIGSKIYDDKITKERSVDINTLMKGVFGFSKPAKRKRSKRKSKRRIKP